METLEQLFDAVRAVVTVVKDAAAAETAKRHAANKAAAEARLEQPGEAEAVLKGKR